MLFFHVILEETKCSRQTFSKANRDNGRSEFQLLQLVHSLSNTRVEGVSRGKAYTAPSKNNTRNLVTELMPHLGKWHLVQRTFVALRKNEIQQFLTNSVRKDRICLFFRADFCVCEETEFHTTFCGNFQIPFGICPRNSCANQIP